MKTYFESVMEQWQEMEIDRIENGPLIWVGARMEGEQATTSCGHDDAAYPSPESGSNRRMNSESD